MIKRKLQPNWNAEQGALLSPGSLASRLDLKRSTHVDLFFLRDKPETELTGR
jgi:hypothetical protein